MAAWNSIWPVGTTALKANATTGVKNTNFIKSTQNIDHFFDDATFGDSSGLHRYIKAPKLEDPDTGDPTDPSLVGPPASDGALYWKEKISDEASVQQDVQPFFMNQVGVDTHIMQVLGIRAMGVFDYTKKKGAKILYSHGVKSVSKASATGTFIVTFSSALPSSSYAVLGGAVINNKNSSMYPEFCVKSSKTNAFKTVNDVTIVITNASSVGTVKQWPKQAWFVVFGG